MVNFVKILVVVGLGVLAGNPDTRTRTYVGQAVDRISKKGLYNEYHEEVFAGTKHVSSTTQYKLLNGSLIAQRKLNFAKGLTNPDYRLDVKKTGYYEGGEMANGKVKVYHYDLELKKECVKYLTVAQPIVIDGGLSNFIKNNFQSIADGKTVGFNFVVPAKLDYFKFRVRKLRNESVSGFSAMTVIIEPDNFLVRSIVEPIEVTYDMASKRIIKYTGISNLPGENGRNYDILLNYAKLGA